MPLRASFISAILFMLAGCVAGGQQPDSQSFDPAPIRAAEREVIAALESVDPTAWVYLYTEDAIFLESGGPPVQGRQALLSMAREMQPLSAVTITPEQTEGHGNLAYVHCTASWTNGRPPNVGTRSSMRGVMIWRMDADGRWRIAQEVLVPAAD